jgi:glyoxylate/hydroxypyruvate reductase
MTNATIGFLGFGRIAQATLVRLIPFRPARVLYTGSQLGQAAKHDYFDVLDKIPTAPATSYEQLAEESDVLFVCCALTEATRGLVDEAFLRRCVCWRVPSAIKPDYLRHSMKARAVIVNTARGAVIETDALAAALKEHRLFGAGLDVLSGEPDIPADHPLLKDVRCVVTPHFGSATLETRGAMSVQAVRDLIAGLRGEAMISEKSLD